MGKMFAQLFSMFTVLFSAGEKLAATVDNLATVAEETSGQYKDQSRINRAKALALAEGNLATTVKRITKK